MKRSPKKRPAAATPFNLILLGDPASGKATQAARIVKRYGMYDFDMGRELLKPAVRRSFDYGGTTARGRLTPTAVVRGILRRTIPRIPARRGILFDGHPKMIGEAKLVAKLLIENRRADPLVLYLRIPMRETMRRAEGRMRDDDTRAALRRRARYYRTEVGKTVSFFRKRYKFEKISGVGAPDEVWKKITRAIEGRFAQGTS